MKTYDLKRRLYIDMNELVGDVIEYLATEYNPKDYDQIDDMDIENAIEYSIDCQERISFYSDSDNWDEILNEIKDDIIEYINTQNVQHELIPIILHYIV